MVFSHKKMQAHSFFLGQVLLCQNTIEFNKPVVLGIIPSYSYSRPPSHLQTVSVKGGIHFILNTTKMLTFKEQGIATPKRNEECSKKGKLCVLEKVGQHLCGCGGRAAQRWSGALIFSCLGWRLRGPARVLTQRTPQAHTLTGLRILSCKTRQLFPTPWALIPRSQNSRIPCVSDSHQMLVMTVLTANSWSVSNLSFNRLALVSSCDFLSAYWTRKEQTP